MTESYIHTCSSAQEILQFVDKATLLKSQFVVGIDTGASNCRVGIRVFSPQENLKTPISHQYVILEFQSTSNKQLCAGLKLAENQLVEIFKPARLPVIGCVIGVAGPVTNHTSCHITNYVTGDSLIHIDRLVDQLTPIGKTYMVNDLESTAYGIRGLANPTTGGCLLDSVFDCTWGPLMKRSFSSVNMSSEQDNIDSKSNENDSNSSKLPNSKLPLPTPIPTATAKLTKSTLRKSGSYLIFALGTGFGTALLLSIENEFHVKPLEASHIAIAYGSEGKEHTQLFKEIGAFVSKISGNNPPEYEDVSSGIGLGRLYQFFCQKNPNAIPIARFDQKYIAQIANSPTEQTKNSIPVDFTPQQWKDTTKASLLALEWYFRGCVHLAQQCGILCQVDGIFLCGRNQVLNSKFFFRNRKLLQESFIDTPKIQWVENVNMYSQTHHCPLNMIGCLSVATAKYHPNQDK